MMAVCCCSMAGIAACKICNNNPDAVAPHFTTITTDTTVWKKPFTNADRIRKKSDEELADFLEQKSKCPPGYSAAFTPFCVYIGGCRDCWLDWMKQEVDDGD